MNSVIVVNGGIVGASAAYHLAHDGFATTLIDRADPGAATFAGAGIVAPGTAGTFPPATIEFTKHAVRYFPPILAALNEVGTTDPGYRTTGKLMISTNDEEDSRLEGIMSVLVQRRDAGMPNLGTLTWTTPEEAREMFPPLTSIRRAIHISDAARVDGDTLRRSLIQAAVHHGAEVRSEDATLSIQDGRVAGIMRDGENIAADAIILAPGSWINELLLPLSVSVPVAPHRGQIVYLSLGDTNTSGWPMMVPLDGKYILPFDPNRIVTGATQEPDAGFAPHPTAAGLHLILDRLLANAPGLANATIDDVRVGLRPWSADGVPFLGAIPGTENVIVATGFGGSGLHLGPYTGLAISRMLHNIPQDVDLQAFRIGRPI
ncbi:MAG: NAD(P)/FAD-dependent oxidoreductase [Thermomicrobiales bacterium]